MFFHLLAGQNLRYLAKPLLMWVEASAPPRAPARVETASIAPNAYFSRAGARMSSSKYAKLLPFLSFVLTLLPMRVSFWAEP